jgi:predicted oxidoreductase
MKNKSIALGFMRIGNLTIDEAEKLIRCALDNDITLFDHADIYGSRKCENIFGEVLKRNPSFRKRMIIQSKCGICKGYYDLSKEHIIKQTEESIRLLNCGYLDILLLHRPDALVDYDEVNEAFNYLYNKGLVKSFGVSNMNPMQIELYNKKLDQKIKHNQVQFSIVHSHMISEGIFVNMTENESCIRSGNLIEYSMLNEISLQAWSPLMASWEDGSFIDNPKYDKLNKKLEELANQYKTTKNSIAISWILRHPANIIPIVGTTKVNHLLEIVKAKEIILTKEEWYSLYLASGHLLP